MHGCPSSRLAPGLVAEDQRLGCACVIVGAASEDHVRSRACHAWHGSRSVRCWGYDPGAASQRLVDLGETRVTCGDATVCITPEPQISMIVT
jgi:hypothetical protein